ncbi:MAG: acylneuraminate cytidylyltransferase family protein [archaeon]|jgi:CMP-N-acetylneuraminic acid synthetase|nr:acylneuraminate cytidylyltransferase family protein [archaeon]
MILLTVCARGGSKGVKNKNIREIAGKPLIAHTIEVAKKWGKADRIVCSTDSEEIAKAARDAGAETPFMRPSELATDEVSKMDVIRHAVGEAEKQYGERYDLIVDLDVTSPVRTSKDLDSCLKIFQENEVDSVFSVTNARKSPYFNVVELNSDGYAHLSKEPVSPIVRRQDAPEVYDMNASIYFYKREFLMNPETESPMSEKSAIYVMDDISSAEIDSELDLAFLEFLIEKGEVSL